MAIADIIMNNPDRIPTIWPNPGNESNIMIQAGIKEDVLKIGQEVYLDVRNTQDIIVQNIVAIDNKTYPIKRQNANAFV